MDITAYVAAAVAAAITLGIRWVVSKSTHSGNVRSSDAETVFQASESVRNDLAGELVACRAERDRYADQLTRCLEAKDGR